MTIVILASKTCRHRPLLEQELRAMDVDYQVRYVEDEPELMEKYGIQHSPNLVVNEKVVFRATTDKRLPTQSELKQCLQAG